MFSSTIMVVLLLLVACALPIFFLILLCMQSTLTVSQKFLGSIPIVILLSLLYLLVQEVQRKNAGDWDYMVKPAIMLFGTMFGASVLTMALNVWRRCVLTEATETRPELPRLSIVAIMEFTFWVAIYCSALTATQLTSEDRIAFMVFSAVGVIPAGITWGWLHLQLGHQTHLRYICMAKLFGGSTLALGVLFALLLAFQSGFADVLTSALVGLAVGLEFNVVFTVILLAAIGWLRGCGWQVRSSNIIKSNAQTEVPADQSSGESLNDFT